jgi:hypothetical protein
MEIIGHVFAMALAITNLTLKTKQARSPKKVMR